MHLRSGRVVYSSESYSRPQTHSSTESQSNSDLESRFEFRLTMEPTLGDVVQSIRDLTVHVDTRLDVLSTRLDTLETTVQRIREGDELYGRGHNHGRDHNFKGNDLRQGHHNLDDRDFPDHDEKLMGRVKIEAPTFDRRLNPEVFSNWMREMDHFFE